jgi:hypothetical protein
MMKGRTENTRKWVVLLCAGVVSMTGCYTRRPPAVTFGRYGTLQPPVVPAAVAKPLDAPPEIATEGVTAPPELAIVRSAPARPRVVPTPTAEPGKPEQQPEPGIAPEFSAQEVESAKAETQRNLDMMEKNLTLSSGKRLNASQEDLVSKVRGFAENAREAMKSGDWVRAKNLSKKAEVLSQELAASL